MANNHWRYSDMVIGFLALFVAGIMGYWAQDRDPPVEFYKIEPANPIIKAGDVLFVHYTVKRNKVCHVRLQQLTVDASGVRRMVTEQDFTADPGPIGSDTFALPLQIPDDMSSGPATYRAIRSYTCNPLHVWFAWPITVMSEPVKFEVIK